ncbi:response regulator transcription factor [Streptomyces sp. NPDC047042]|uniref:response regulator transcription factor n=1 Tax=Streptomyces sp. NPDC047042 TaxID=3154807 RepID=UPI0033EE9A94
MRVLVIEDEAATAESIVSGLRRHGFEADWVDSGKRALENHQKADFIVLDLGLPDTDGLEVCRRIRNVSDTPIIAVAERQNELERVLGLQAGSDDCIDRSYGIHELVARIQAIMRRIRPANSTAGGLITHGPLSIDISSREVRLHDEPMSLTRKEFDLLRALTSQPGTVLTRQDLMAQVWHDTWAKGRTIDTHVNSLRGKLGCSDWIVTVRGVGFRFVPWEDVHTRYGRESA